MPDRITVPDRTVLHQIDAVFTEKTDRKEKEQRKLVVAFTNMLPKDIPELQIIHDSSWGPGLGLSIGQFESYYENFGDIGVCALLVDGDDPERFQVLGGINVMRTNLVARLDGVEPDIWAPTERDRIPLKWNELTNGGYFDAARLRGDWRKIWPARKGRTVICPTVYIKKTIGIRGRDYLSAPLMKGMITAVKKRVETQVALEGKSMQVCAFSAPRGKSEFPYMPINDYLFMSKQNKAILMESMNCEKEGVTGEALQRRLYAAYTESGGTEKFDAFADGDIAKFSMMESGADAFPTYKDNKGYTRIDEFLRVTARKPLDPVLGQHVFCGGWYAKVLPEGREEDVLAEGFNVLVMYGGIMLSMIKKDIIAKETSAHAL